MPYERSPRRGSRSAPHAPARTGGPRGPGGRRERPVASRDPRFATDDRPPAARPRPSARPDAAAPRRPEERPESHARPPVAAAPAGVTHVVATADDEGQRLDNWLLRRMKGVPKSHVYRILRRGEVRVNGKRAKPETRVSAGDDVRLPPVRSAAEIGPPRVPDSLRAAVEAAIVHEDRDLLALAKPAGLAVHGGSGLSFGVIEALRASRPEETLELVHRLDRDTSGLLLVARNRPALRTLHALIREGRLEKRYLALVRGQWDLGRKTIDVPLDVRAKQGGERMVRVREGGKASESTFEAVDFYGARGTLMQVDIATGRTHQIRVHAAFAGHPIAGDEKYGDREFNAEMRELGLTRMFLHAHAVSFEWPDSGRTFAVSVPLPPELASVVERLATTRRRRARR
jgi:23S rRNA pseudouridine955/2504/2580 synthase